MADDTVTIIFGARIAELVAGVGEVKEQLAELGEMAQKVGELFGIGFAAKEIKEFIESMAELGETTERMSLMIGVSTEKIGEMKGIAALTGTSMEGLMTTLERMNLNIQRANRDGITPVSEALRVLGLSAKDLINLPADRYFDKLGEAASKLNPSMNLTAALMTLGGRGVAQQIPALLEGKEAYEKYHQAIHETGSEMSELTAKGLAESNQAFTILGLSMQGLGITIFERFKSTIDGVTSSMTDFVQWLRKATEEGGALAGVMQIIVDVAKALGFVFATLVAAFQVLAEGVGFVAKVFTFRASIEEAEKMAEALENIGDSYNKTLNKIYGNPLHVEVNPEEHKRDVDTMNAEGAKDALAAAMQASQTRIRLADLEYQQTSEKLASGVKTFELTEDQKTAFMLQAVDQRVAIQLSEINKELSLGGLTKAERQKLEDEKTLIVAKAEKDRQKIIDEGRQADIKSWTTDLSVIQSAWDNQLKGLLARTTTWAQAMKNIAADLILAIIKEFEKIVIVEQLAKVMGDLFKGFDLTGIFKMIAASTAQVFAAVSAYMAPIIGPYAPAAGATAAAATAAGAAAFAAAPIPQAESGAWNIPGTSPWLLHKGETVLPARAAETFRRMSEGFAGGGGGSLNIFAMDGADVMRVVTRHAGAISKALNGHMVANPSTHG